MSKNYFYDFSLRRARCLIKSPAAGHRIVMTCPWNIVKGRRKNSSQGVTFFFFFLNAKKIVGYDGFNNAVGKGPLKRWGGWWYDRSRQWPRVPFLRLHRTQERLHRDSGFWCEFSQMYLEYLGSYISPVDKINLWQLERNCTDWVSQVNHYQHSWCWCTACGVLPAW